ncbi:MAG: ATP-binding cassette domain-containing protein [Chloroflexota bacterium]|nr:ATP-binding cassette domain-containing protein [Chloroflexota bacterium]
MKSYGYSRQAATHMIAIENLTKTYGGTRAVDGLSLEVHHGEMFGFLGPNGAGKTTTIRILTTLTKPDSGKVSLNGFDITAQSLAVRKEFGVVQQHLSLDRELTAWECMELHARLHHIPAAERKRRIADLFDYVELNKKSNQTVMELSSGMKRRLMIARALIHRPRVLFLDEPTVGLDAQSRRRLWELIRRMNLDGTTVFLTTHYIEEAEALCNRVGVIHNGKLIALGSPLELRSRLGLITVETMTDDKIDYAFFPDLEAATAYVNNLPDGIKPVAVRESNLEDIFVELTGRKVEEGV